MQSQNKIKLKLTFLKATTSSMLVNSIITPNTKENKAKTINMLRTEINNEI